jgi:hypothetical protein
MKQPLDGLGIADLDGRGRAGQLRGQSDDTAEVVRNGGGGGETFRGGGGGGHGGGRVGGAPSRREEGPRASIQRMRIEGCVLDAWDRLGCRWKSWVDDVDEETDGVDLARPARATAPQTNATPPPATFTSFAPQPPGSASANRIWRLRLSHRIITSKLFYRQFDIARLSLSPSQTSAAAIEPGPAGPAAASPHLIDLRTPTSNFVDHDMVTPWTPPSSPTPSSAARN